jgi:hypothetical protein
MRALGTLCAPALTACFHGIRSIQSQLLIRFGDVPCFLGFQGTLFNPVERAGKVPTKEFSFVFLDIEIDQREEYLQRLSTEQYTC